MTHSEATSCSLQPLNSLAMGSHISCWSEAVDPVEQELKQAAMASPC